MRSRLNIRIFLLVFLLALVNTVGEDKEDDKLGILELSSTPPGLSVFLEGFPAGTTPVSVEKLPPGEYRVVIRTSEGDVTRDVEVGEGDRVVLAVDVEGEELCPCSQEFKSEDMPAYADKDERKRYEKAGSKKKLGGYGVLEIANFVDASEDPVPPDHLYTLFGSLAVALDKKGRFSRYVTDYTKAPSEKWSTENAGDSPTLVLSGLIPEYQRGSRAKRYMVGFGAGKTRMYCQFRLTDKSSGEVLLERVENGSVSIGLFGGSSSGATKELAEDIVKAINKNW